MSRPQFNTASPQYMHKGEIIQAKNRNKEQFNELDEQKIEEKLHNDHLKKEKQLNQKRFLSGNKEPLNNQNNMQ